MRYLIDGYNLLHAWGLAPPPGQHNRLHQARMMLLDRLWLARTPSAEEVVVVFDAAAAPPRAAPEKEYHGIRVCFATKESADDRIEEFIRTARRPREWIVVSDDHRIQQAAERGHARAQGCLDFLETLQHPRQALPPQPPAEVSVKPDGSSPEEMRHWLAEFGGGEDEPGFDGWAW
jgi:predicted RNA-binding protein with PIN domain